MRKGFLSTRSTPESPNPVRSTASVQDAERVESQLQECLQLLRGPSDERRFVGLLLATRLLPAGDADAIRRVYAAVGPTFIARLLAPLRSGNAAQQGPETLQKQAATAALGLAVLSAFVRVPELAASGELIEMLPLFLKVAQAGGVMRVVSAAAGASLRADEATDAAAVQDALECAVAVALSGDEGRRVAAESGAVGAATSALLHCSTSTAGRQRFSTLLFAVRLASAALASPDRPTLLAAGGDALQQLVPCLARLLAAPASLDREEAQQGQQGARLQLEALHALLLVLPPPLPAAAGLHASLARAAGSGGWSQDIRTGLSLLLRGRIGAVQRHGALQLAAAAAGIAGPEWLLGPATGATPDAGAFFQLIVEITKIETSVLLHDALAPLARVPLAAAPGLAAGEWEAPLARGVGVDKGGEGGDEDELSDEEPIPGWDDLPSVIPHEGGDSRGGGVAAAVAGCRAEEEATAQQAEREGRPPLPGEVVEMVESVEVPLEAPWEAASEAAGERAARMLPACFALLEAEIEALARDAQRAEAAAEADAESLHAAAGTGEAVPALSGAVAQRAITSLQEAVEVVLQFLEQTLDGPEAQAELEDLEESQRRQRQQLVVAAVRLAGRFGAEVPEAFGPRLRALLPRLLAVRSTPGAPSGDEDDGGRWEAAPPPAEGLLFLLPLLIQVTHPSWVGGGAASEAEQAEWFTAASQPEVSRPLATHARSAAAATAAAATGGRAGAASEALLSASALLLRILQPRPPSARPPATQGPAPAAPLDRVAGGGEWGAWGAPLTAAALPLLEPLCAALAGMQGACTDAAADGAELEQARLVTCCSALLAVVLCKVANEAATAAAATGADSVSSQGPGVLGPLTPDVVAAACERVLAGMRQAYAALCTLRPGHRDRSGDLQEHYDTLVDAARTLLSCCPAFEAACRRCGWLMSLRGGADAYDEGMRLLLQVMQH